MRSAALLAALATLLLAACEDARRPVGPYNSGTPAPARPDGGASAQADRELDAGREEAPDGGAAVFDAAERPADDAAPPAFPDAATPSFPDAATPSFPDAATPTFPDAATAFPDAATAFRDAAVALVDAGTPACRSDGDCASGRCHPIYGQCVPPGQLPSCSPCTTSAQCGLPGDACLDVSTAQGAFVERVCAQACNRDDECPRGNACSLEGHCYPTAGSIRPHTCASFADLLARESCSVFGGPDTCGVPNFDDGTCVPTLGCTVGCVSDADCPERSTCTFFLVDNYCVAD